MSIKKFIKRVKKILDIDILKEKSKKKSLKKLLKKLENRRETLAHTPRKKLHLKERKSLKEEESIISLQIKKGNKILEEMEH